MPPKRRNTGTRPMSAIAPVQEQQSEETVATRDLRKRTRSQSRASSDDDNGNSDGHGEPGPNGRNSSVPPADGNDENIPPRKRVRVSTTAKPITALVVEHADDAAPTPKRRGRPPKARPSAVPAAALSDQEPSLAATPRTITVRSRRASMAMAPPLPSSPMTRGRARMEAAAAAAAANSSIAPSMVRVPAAFAAEHQALPPATISVLVPRTKRSPRVDASSTPIPEPAAIEDDATVTSATVPATMTGDHLNNARTVSLLPNQAPIQDQLSPVADTEADTKVDAEADAPRSMSRASTPGLSDPKTPPRKTPPRKSAVTVMPPPHTPRSALSTRPLMVPWTTGHAVVAARPATPRSVRINMDLTSVVRTHSPREYDRSPLPDITKNQRSARKISDRHWRNLVRSVDRFKAREMAVHPDSRGNTRLYLGPVSPPSATSSEGSNEFDLFADPRKNDEDDEDEDQVAQPASPLRGKKGTAAGASVLGSATKPSPSNHVAAAAPPHTPPSQVVLNSDEDENEEEDENRAGSPDITPTARSVSSRTSLLPLESPGLSALLPPRKVLGYLPPLPPAQPKFTAETHPVSIPIVAVAAAATENTEPVAATPLPATPSKLFSKSPVTVTPGSASRILSSMFRSVGTVISRMSSSSSRHSGSDD